MKAIVLFLTLAGFVIGHGSVTVIDMHGFLARKSKYWTEATIRTHRVTKPLIWIGTSLVLIGFFFLDRLEMLSHFSSVFAYVLLGVMIINGCFLTFIISPELLRREKEGIAREILPQVMQKKITISFVVSFISWWTLLGVLAVNFVRV